MSERAFPVWDDSVLTYRDDSITLGELEDYIRERMGHYNGDTETNTYATASHYYALKELNGLLDRFVPEEMKKQSQFYRIGTCPQCQGTGTIESVPNMRISKPCPYCEGRGTV